MRVRCTRKLIHGSMRKVVAEVLTSMRKTDPGPKRYMANNTAFFYKGDVIWRYSYNNKLLTESYLKNYVEPRNVRVNFDYPPTIPDQVHCVTQDGERPAPALIIKFVKRLRTASIRVTRRRITNLISAFYK